MRLRIEKHHGNLFLTATPADPLAAPLRLEIRAEHATLVVGKLTEAWSSEGGCFVWEGDVAEPQ